MKMKKRKYDLEDRTFKFAKSCLVLVNKVRKTLGNVEISRQLIRASGSVGANYIEANESISKKDFVYRIKICRKEAKESAYWIRLLELDENLTFEGESLIQESMELTNIFGSIFRNVTRS